MSTDNPSAFPSDAWVRFATHAPAIPKGLPRPGTGWGHKAAIDIYIEWSILYADTMMEAIAKRAKPTPIPHTLSPRTEME